MGKPLILYDNRLNDGTPVATTTDTGYDVLNLKDLRSYTFWQAANTTTPCYITVDCGSAKSADCLGIFKHNFNTIGASISVECSSDNFASDTTVALAAFAPATDKAILKTFTTVSKRYWRLKINGTLSAKPYMAILMLGSKLELSHEPDTPFQLIDEGVESETSKSNAGHILGSVIFYHPIEIICKISWLARTWVTDTFKPFWDNHGSLMKPFFFAWDLTNYSTYIYWAKFQNNARFKIPLSISPYVDSLELNMEAARE